MSKPAIYAFDFDGTLTTRDTLIAFIAFARGRAALVRSLLLFAPLLVPMKLHLYPNWKAKQKLFAHLFAGMPEHTFNTLCADFAHAHRHLLRPATWAVLKQALQSGAQVYVVTASIDRWVIPFFTRQGLHVEVLGTQIAVEQGLLTGRFSSPNCYGSEKVRRLQAVLPPRHTFHLTAYGDSHGDDALLAWADEAHRVG